MLQGRVEEAAHTVELLPDGGAPYTQAEKLCQVGYLQLICGELAAARNLGRELRRVAAEAGEHSSLTRSFPYSKTVAAWTDGWAEIGVPQSVLRSDVSAEGCVLHGFAALAAAAHDDRSRVDELAAADLDLVDRMFEDRHPIAGFSLALFSMAVGAMSLPDLAGPLLHRLDPGAGCILSAALPVISADALRADLRRVIGDHEGAEAIAREAIETSRIRGTIGFLAYELMMLAHTLASSGAAPQEVTLVALESRDIADRIGAGMVRQELARRELLG